MNEESVKPTLFRGQPIRLLDLTSDGFENFVYATMAEWASLHGFRVISGPSESSDSGFDVTGERQEDGKSVCIQCKRLKGTFHLNGAGPELAKVALKTALEGAQVVEHFVIATGSVGETLRSALRSKPRTTLAKAAADAAEKHADLATLRSKARERGFNVRDIVEKYVLQLERLRVWSGRDFDQELGRVWSKIIPLLERFFQVEIVFGEYPRPDFDRAQYLQSLAAEAPSDLIRLRAVLTDLPPNVDRTRGEDPLAEGRDSRDGDPKEEEGVLNVVTTLIQTPLKTCTILHGKSGSGKTTTLKLVLGAVAAEPSTCDDGPLPVFVRLSSYQGRLQDQIHAALHITHGTWTSLPGPFLLLLDGLDEMPTAQVQPLLDELDLVLRDESAACVLTIRGAGLRTHACLARARMCLRILPLTLRDVIDIAKSRISSDQRESFLTQLRSRLRELWPSLLFLPFGCSAAIKIFVETGTLPSTSEKLIEGILIGRFKRNHLRSNSMEERLRDVPDAVVRGLAEAIAFEFRIKAQRASVTVQEAHEMVARSLALVKSENRFGVSTLSDLDALVLLKHYEFLESSPDGRMQMPHDIMADFLAASRLAANWQHCVDHLESAVGQDAWSYASSLIPFAQQGVFLEAIAATDPIQAATCAAAMGGRAPELIEPLVFALDNRNGILPIFQTASCMGVLGTPACLARLRDHIRRAPKGSNRHYQAERALAQRGDEATLRFILTDEEPLVSSGLGGTGGQIDLWFQAPPDVTLSLARQRLDAMPANPCVVLSLRTIELYGDDTDFARVRSALEKGSSLAAFYAAAHCLLAFDRQRAVEILTSDAVLLPAVEQVPYAEVLSTAKAPLDTSPLLDELLNGSDPTNVSPPNIRRRILEIVKKERLPDGYEPRIRAAFEKADEYQQSDLWQVATAHRLRAFDDLAFAALSCGGMNEVGSAANFAKVREWQGEMSDRFAALCIDRAGAANGTEWHFPRMLEYLLQIGKEAQVAALLEPRLRDLVPRHKAARRRFRKEALSRRRNGVDNPAEEEEFQLSVVIPDLVKIAANLSSYIPRDVAREIVGLDLSSAGDEARAARCAIARCLSAVEIDAALMEIDEPGVRIQVLGGISDIGATPTRIEILCQELPKVLCWPMCKGALVRAVDNLWSRQVALASVNAIATVKWPEYGSQLAHEFVDVVARRMTSELASAVVLPQIETTKDTDSREILQYWYDIGTLARR
jgi:energy-coupling factor transporter ATP-binding protein EcfA2